MQQSSSQTQPVSSALFAPSYYYPKTIPVYSPFNIEDELHFSFPKYFEDSSATKMPVDDNILSSSQSESLFERVIDHQYSEASLLNSFVGKSNSPTFAQKVATRTDRRPLTKEERMEFYNFLDGVLGPANGVQENVGTYKAYMAEQSRLYFERLLPDSQQHMRKVQAQTYVRSQNLYQSEVAPEGSVNFRKWLASDNFGDSSWGIQQNSSHHYSPDGTRHSVTNPTIYKYLSEDSDRMSSGGITSCAPSSYYPEDASGFGGTLDDLFPDWPQNTFSEDAIIGSPVVRSNLLGYGRTNRSEHVTRRQEAPISPTLLDLDSQQTSPDIGFSPLVQTPDIIHQQFTQRKNNDFIHQSPSLTLQNTAYQGDPGLQDLLALDPHLLLLYGIGLKDAEFKDTSTRFDTSSLPISSDTTRSSIEIAKITPRRVNRLRTTSAGGGI